MFSFNRMNMTTDFPYIISQYIREYDISKCNISMLYRYNKISKNLYNNLYNSDKTYREIYIGKMIKKNPELYRYIKEGIITYRNILFSSNKIQENDIVSIKSDAVFIVNKVLNDVIFDDIIEFKNKNIYTSFIKLDKKELYYNINTDIIDVKGISDIKLCKHNSYILDFIKTVIYLIEINNFKDAIKVITDFYFDYINYNVDFGYFREFNSDSMFIINNIKNHMFDIPISNNKYDYNISYNIRILMELNKIVSSLIMSNN